MKKLISFLIGVLIIALVITCIVAFTTCDGCDVPKTNVETEDKGDNSQEEDISFYIRYNGEDVENGSTLTLKEYDLNGIDVWGSGSYTATVVINRSAPFNYSVNGEQVSSAAVNVDITQYCIFTKTPTGFDFGVKHLNFIEHVLSKVHAVDDEDAKIEIDEDISEKYIYKLTIRDSASGKRLSINFNLESASLELPGKIII